VVALVRRAKSVEASNKLTEKVIDFDKLQKEDFQCDASVLFISLGTTIKAAGSVEAFQKVDYTYVTECCKMAKAAGISRVHVVSSIDADATSSNMYLGVKGKAEEAIGAMGFASASFYRPSVLDAPRGGQRCGERSAVCCLRYLICCCMRCCCPVYDVILPQTVAVAMVEQALAEHRRGGIVVVYNGSAVIERLAHKPKRS